MEEATTVRGDPYAGTVAERTFMEQQGFTPATGSYRIRLIEELHREACARGLYKTVLPPEKPDPASDFHTAVNDMLFLLDHLPSIESGSSITAVKGQIRIALKGCRSDLMGKIPEDDIFYLMRFAHERSNGRYKPSPDELTI